VLFDADAQVADTSDAALLFSDPCCLNYGSTPFEILAGCFQLLASPSPQKRSGVFRQFVVPCFESVVSVRRHQQTKPSGRHDTPGVVQKASQRSPACQYTNADRIARGQTNCPPS
jgi:hypothetical protein